MSVHDFWHGDIELLQAYQTAYIRDVSFRAWAIGQEMTTSTLMALGVAFSTKKEANITYPEWEDPIEKLKEKGKQRDSIDKNEINKKFTATMKNQVSFIHNLLREKKD